MASDAVLTFTDDNFDEQVLQSDTPVLIDFWAEWCMPCKMLAPVIDKLAEQYGDRLKVGKMDTDGNKTASTKYGVHAIPTVIIFKGGEEVERLTAMQPENVYVAAIDRVLGGGETAEAPAAAEEA